MTELAWPLGKIINVANELQLNGSTAASTSEQIAAAFVLDQMDYLPAGYDTIEAWERLDNWQGYVKLIRRDYMHLVESGPTTRL